MTAAFGAARQVPAGLLTRVQTGTMTDQVRVRARITGVVQGVGFRPFVYSLANQLGLSGFVGNDVDGVFLEVENQREPVQRFLAALSDQAPPLAKIHSVSTAEVPITGIPGFTISESEPTGRANTLIAADNATCLDCSAEITDPTNQRYRYAFTNCTNCGPRFTIVTGVPYDRPLTTMAGFEMCPRCAAEYHDPSDRRFHAQPVCCPRCGPQLSLVDQQGETIDTDPIDGAAAMLDAGAVLGIKGLGGYHLATDATNDRACARLRARKHREDKAFAVMVADLSTARDIATIDESAASVLGGARRPIVLLPKKSDAEIAHSVAPHNREVGIMLAYTPMHELLLAATARPIVLTSGNVSDEPIAYRDVDAFNRLGAIADSFLTHDRAIHIRADDSVVRPPEDARQEEILIRRSRGYVPEPLHVPWNFRRPVLACGAEQKNTFCLCSDERAFVSHHIGDLENLETLQSFTEGIEHFQRLFAVTPQIVAYDPHPEYLSTKHARKMRTPTKVGVQHHHAHIAACLADNRVDDTAIGVAFDGTGYGTDGTIWGGEFLLADLCDFKRVATLAPVPMPGGSAAIKHPWRMAAAYLDVAFDGQPPEGLAVRERNEEAWETIRALADRKLNSPLTSSAGRLFDAVAALVGVRDSVNYEGQAAVELEQIADPRETASYPMTPVEMEVQQLPSTGLVRAVVTDLLAGVDPAKISARFHNGLAELIVRTSSVLRDRTECSTVALSGGVFSNVLLLRSTVRRLRQAEFRVLTHSRVPCNDGGISFGQAVVAGARDRAGLLD